MLDKIKTALIFFRLVDANDGVLSISNIALYIVLGKLVITPTSSLTDTVPMFLALANYSFKKYLNAPSDPKETT